MQQRHPQHPHGPQTDLQQRNGYRQITKGYTVHFKSNLPRLSPNHVRTVFDQDPNMTPTLIPCPVTEVLQSIAFFPIVKRDFQDLLNKYPQADFTGDRFPSTLRCQTQKRLGVPGSLKSAHPGWLTLVTPPYTESNILGTMHNEFVAVKRVFYLRPDTPDKLLRYPIHEEMDMIRLEGNAMYWATSLMGLVYSYVDNAIIRDLRPPPHIPRVSYYDNYSPSV